MSEYPDSIQPDRFSMGDYFVVAIQTEGVLQTRGRRLSRHGIHGKLHTLPGPFALRMVEAGIASVFPSYRLEALREHCAALETSK